MKKKSTPTSSELIAAIKAKCMDCCCNQRKLVNQCKSEECALWKYRKREEETEDD